MNTIACARRLADLRGAVAAVALICLACDTSGDVAERRVDTTRFLVDDDGGALILHGSNIESAAKSSPDNQPAHLIEADAAHMANEWGLDFVRYLIFWSAIEPEQGVYDDAYLDEVETRLDWFAAQGIHVMLDMHQDVYSARFCCDGAPDWAIHAPWEDYVINTAVWSFNYFSPEVKQAFDAFWSYEGEHQVLQDHYVAMWRHVAERFKDHPAVLGYDVMNEPHQGSGFDVIALTLRRDLSAESPLGVFESGPFADFYQRVIDGIRREDRDSYIFVEPSYGIPGDGGPSFLPLLDDPRSGASKIAYAPHLYSFRLEAAETYAADDGIFPRWRANREADGVRMETPMLIGEWGLSMDFPGSERFVDELLTLADDMLVGWAHWSWDPNGSWSMWNVGPDGPGRWEERPLMDRLVRTYPMRVAGEPTALSFDPATAEMRLTYATRREAHGETEIFVPARHYPDGYEVVVSAPEGSYSVRTDAERQRVYVLVNEPGEHEIVVRRAAP